MFWDSLDSTIHSDQSLTPVQKFSYLLASLQGSAAATINELNLHLSSANDNAAVTLQLQLLLLKERYGNTHNIINALMDALGNLSTVINACDLQAMWPIYDEVQVNVPALSQCKWFIKQTNMEDLRHLMLHKIPEEIRLNSPKASVMNYPRKLKWNLGAVLKELRE